MKKVMLLSVVASGLIYAGGDIAPVAPVAPQAAPAACDFYGSIGFRYEFKSDKKGHDLFKSANNGSKATVVLGVNKDLGYGFGLGAEVASTIKFDGKLKKKSEDSELSQLFLTYKNGATSVKLGRQALSKTVSPWAWSDNSLGRLDTTFNAITVVNTSIENTTLVGAWVPQLVKGSTNTKINGSNKGLFMLGVSNKSLSNSTINASLYYIPKNKTNGKAFSVWSSIDSKISGVKVGLQAAYAKADAGSVAQKGAGTKATTAIAAYVGSSFSGVNAKFKVAYINAGNATLNLGGTSGFWGDSVGSSFGGDVKPANGKQKIAELGLDTKVYGGKLYTNIGIDKPDTGKTAFAARVGYTFKINKVGCKVEYRYQKNKDFTDRKDHRVRLEAKYKF